MKLLLLLLIPLMSTSAYGQEDRLDELTKRIEELEKQQEELILQASEAQINPVASFLKSRISFGGFFEPSYTAIAGPDTDLQASNSSNILGINIAADFKQRLHFVSQFLTGLTFRLQNEHNHPNPSGTTPDERQFGSLGIGAVLSQGYLEYTFDSGFRLQGGMGYVPFGYAFQQRELVLFVRRGGPQVLRTSDLVSPLWSGFNFVAHKPLKNSAWGYNIYSFSPLNSPSHPGLGARTYWSNKEERFTAGLSAQHGKIGAKNFDTIGTDLRLNYSPFLITAEFVQGMFQGADPWSTYLETGYYLYQEEVLLFVFGDYSYNVRNRDGATSPTSFRDPIQKYEYGAGVNWLPTSYTRLRAGLTFHEYVGNDSVIEGQDRDYTSLDLSAGVAF